MANSFTRDIKIKVSPDGSDQGVYFDYLFALAPSASDVNDGLNTADRYFVYDPDVSTNVAQSNDQSNVPDVKASTAIATVSNVALAALAVAMFFQG